MSEALAQKPMGFLTIMNFTSGCGGTIPRECSLSGTRRYLVRTRGDTEAAQQHGGTCSKGLHAQAVLWHSEHARLETLLYVLAIHRIADPVSFRRIRERPHSNRPVAMRLVHALPSRGEEVSICLWETCSLELLRSYMDDVCGQTSTNEYYQIDLEQLCPQSRILEIAVSADATSSERKCATFPRSWYNCVHCATWRKPMLDRVQCFAGPLNAPAERRGT